MLPDNNSIVTSLQSRRPTMGRGMTAYIQSSACEAKALQ